MVPLAAKVHLVVSVYSQTAQIAPTCQRLEPYGPTYTDTPLPVPPRLTLLVPALATLDTQLNYN